MIENLTSTAAKAREALGSAGTVHGVSPHGPPRFELFHAANSICSHKVRAVLAHHALPYIGHSLNLFFGQSYLPEYVRLRMVGCEALGGTLASLHSGSTSTSAGGCDGAVVPTLIDWEAEEVIVDSRRICAHLDDQFPAATKLRPLHLADAIDEQLAIVDNLPNYQMLMGRTPSASEGTTTKDSIGGSFSQKKVAWCDQYLTEHHDDVALVAAYTAKRAKEMSAAKFLFAPSAMQGAYGQAEKALEELEQLLARRNGPWLLGEAVTMADLFWGIELLRMKNMEIAALDEAERLPQIMHFLAAVEVLPAIREAIVDWPSALF